METREAPYQFEHRDTHAVLVLYPLINEGQWGNVSEVGTEIVGRLESSKSPSLIVDLSPLDYMGSAQVALLVRVWKSLKQNEGKMVVQCPGEMVREVLTIAGLKSLWSIVETRDAALGELGLQGAGTTEKGRSASGLATGAVGLIAMGIGVGLVLAGTRPELKLWGGLACGGIGFLAGALTIWLERGVWRFLGLLVLLVSSGLLGYSGMHLSRAGAAPAETAAETGTSETASPSTTEKSVDKAPSAGTKDAAAPVEKAAAVPNPQQPAEPAAKPAEKNAEPAEKNAGPPEAKKAELPASP